MRGIGCLPSALSISALLLTFTYIYMSFWPYQEVVINFPKNNAVVRFQSWGSLLEEKPYTLRIDNRHGTLSLELWANWGPADTINLYRTPENWLAGIGGGGNTYIVDITKSSAPRLIQGEEQNRTNDENWIFLGYAGGNSFVPASELPECVALLGAGYSAYRKQYQALHSCQFNADEATN